MTAAILTSATATQNAKATPAPQPQANRHRDPRREHRDDDHCTPDTTLEVCPSPVRFATRNANGRSVGARSSCKRTRFGLSDAGRCADVPLHAAERVRVDSLLAPEAITSNVMIDRLREAADALNDGDPTPLVALMDDDVDWRAVSRGFLWWKHTPS
jgi:hypothetical protein